MIGGNKTIIGRKEEQEYLNDRFNSHKSEFIAVYGRRRVGKTFLIREMLKSNFLFYATGILNGTLSEQLNNFNQEIIDYGGENFIPAKNWNEAFRNLNYLVERSNIKGKKVIFLDEIPWMNTSNSGFLSALDHFWNRYASMRTDILLIICGSASSWIFDNIVNNTGGLHNRLTGEIYLKPFSLKESEEFFESKNINIPRFQIAEAYMIFGGIPYYLDLFQSKLSLVQNVDAIFFKENAPLRNEYVNVLRSLFKNADNHIRIIEALAERNYGKTREDIINATGITCGGGLSKTLNELIANGFIREYQSYGKTKRDCFYQLIDPFILFNLRFSSKRNAFSSDFWMRFCRTPSHATWTGYAFEILCLLHIEQIRKALGISGVLTEIYSWRSKLHEPGAQIDLVIERGDQVINLCEIKYATDKYSIDKEYDKNLRKKLSAFVNETKTRKAAHITLITTYGLAKNMYQAAIPFEVVLDELFQ